MERASEAADAFWGRRVFPPSELDHAVEEYNAIHSAVNHLFGDRCLPVGRFDLIYRDWRAAGDLASRARRLASFLAGQRRLLLEEQRRLLQSSE